MDLGLAGRVALVTGAARGIGAEIAAVLAREGCHVFATDVDGAGAQRTAARIGPPARGLRMDVTSRAEIAAAVGEVVSAAGRLDVLINDAGIIRAQPFLETAQEDWDALLAVNLTGVWDCCRAAVPAMMRGGGGSIVNLSSVAAALGGGSVGNVAYGVTKAGVEALTRGLARELGPRGIRVNAIAPALVDTEMVRPFLTPELRSRIAARFVLGRIGQTSDIAAVAAFLASDAAAFVTGETLAADGGLLKT
jgi:NAD(P)-dependent dehydrogenase (short-subunit alcohol dehydrogenase family)